MPINKFSPKPPKDLPPLPKKETKTRNIVVDEDELIGVPLGRAISFLTKLMGEHPDKELYLDLNLHGYDTASLDISYDELETDEELAEKHASILRARAEVERAAKAKKDRDKDMKEYKRLQGKLGLF